jgi:orotidine-5'-phosphate decarboxylase
VAGAVAGASRTGARMLTVHASGGVRMMRAARDAADRAAGEGAHRPLIVGVTVLTSLSAEELHDEVGCALAPPAQVVALARRAQEAGLDGVVASPNEAQAIRAACGPDFLIVTPGIRLAGSAADDQRRVATPRMAIDAGANFLVVGRPITQAPDPAAAYAAVLADVQAARGA